MRKGLKGKPPAKKTERGLNAKSGVVIGVHGVFWVRCRCYRRLLAGGPYRLAPGWPPMTWTCLNLAAYLAQQHGLRDGDGDLMGRACHRCGAPVLVGAEICPACGHHLEPEDE